MGGRWNGALFSNGIKLRSKNQKPFHIYKLI